MRAVSLLRVCGVLYGLKRLAQRRKKHKHTRVLYSYHTYLYQVVRSVDEKAFSRQRNVAQRRKSMRALIIIAPTVQHMLRICCSLDVRYCSSVCVECVRVCLGTKHEIFESFAPLHPLRFFSLLFGNIHTYSEPGHSISRRHATRTNTRTKGMSVCYTRDRYVSPYICSPLAGYLALCFIVMCGISPMRLEIYSPHLQQRGTLRLHGIQSVRVRGVLMVTNVP